MYTQISSHRLIPSPVSSGKKQIHIDTNSNRVADGNDPILVKMTDDGWQPVEQLDAPIDRFTLEKDYGYWKDREIAHYEGWPWNRQKVVDRPLDGKVDADELSFTQFQRLGNSNTFEVGAELTQDSGGRLTLEEHFKTFGSLRIIGQGDVNRMKDFRANDENWKVPPAPGARQEEA